MLVDKSSPSHPAISSIPENCSRKRRLLVDRTADAAIGELRSQLSETLAENAKRDHLDNPGY